MMKTRLGDASIFPSCQALWQLNLSDGTAPPQTMDGCEGPGASYCWGMTAPPNTWYP